MTEQEIEVRSGGNSTLIKDRRVYGHAIVFNTESRQLGAFKEVILPQAITQELLDQSDIRVYLNHDKTKGILARSKQGSGSLTYYLDEKGVSYEFDSPKTALGDELLEGLKRGDYSESSFAFAVEKDKWVRRGQDYIRYVEKIKLIRDFSIVDEAAYAQAEAGIAMRSLEEFKKTEVETPQEEPIEPVEETPQNEPQVEPSEQVEEPQVEEAKEETPIEQVEETKEETPQAEPEVEKAEENPQINTLETETRSIPEENQNLQNTIMSQKFSLLKTISDVANNRTIDEAAAAVIEQGRAEMRSCGGSHSGQIVLPLETRGIVSAGEGLGAEAIATDTLNILEPLYANLVMTQAGATFMTGLTGDCVIPIFSGTSVTWKGEIAGAEDGAGSFSEVTLSPKRLTAYLDISKQFLNQTSASAEQMLRNDIIRALQAKLESTILGAGAGSATQPAGLFNGVVADTAAIDFKGIVGMEESLESANVTGEKVFIVHPSAKAILKTTAKAANTAAFLMDGNEINGYKTLTSSAVSPKGVIFGDFSDYIIGSWGGIDVTVDAVTQAVNGCVRLVINAYFDAKPRRAVSFAKKILK